MLADWLEVKMKKMSRKAANFGIVVVVIAVVILGAVGVFYFFGDKEETQPKPAPIQDHKLSFTMQPCSEVDELFNCRGSSVFKPGDKLYFLIKLQDIKVAELNGISYYDLEIRKQLSRIADGAVLMNFDESLENIKREVALSSRVNVPIVISLNTFPQDTAGNYEYALRVKDKTSGEEYPNNVKIELQ